jgi:hypothetical protein
MGKGSNSAEKYIFGRVRGYAMKVGGDRKKGWNYREDVVAIQKADNPMDLREDFIQHMEVWVQLYRLPAEMLTLQGIELLFRQLGTVMFEV